MMDFYEWVVLLYALQTIGWLGLGFIMGWIGHYLYNKFIPECTEWARKY